MMDGFGCGGIALGFCQRGRVHMPDWIGTGTFSGDRSKLPSMPSSPHTQLCLPSGVLGILALCELAQGSVRPPSERIAGFSFSFLVCLACTCRSECQRSPSPGLWLPVRRPDYRVGKDQVVLVVLGGLPCAQPCIPIQHSGFNPPVSIPLT